MKGTVGDVTALTTHFRFYSFKNRLSRIVCCSKKLIPWFRGSKIAKGPVGKLASRRKKRDGGKGKMGKLCWRSKTILRLATSCEVATVPPVYKWGMHYPALIYLYEISFISFASNSSGLSRLKKAKFCTYSWMLCRLHFFQIPPSLLKKMHY